MTPTQLVMLGLLACLYAAFVLLGVLVLRLRVQLATLDEGGPL